MIEGFFTAAGTLAVVVAVLFAAWWFTRKVAGGAGASGRSRYMRIIDRIPLSQDKSIILVQIGEKIYMAGVAPSSISILAEMSEKPEELPDQPAAPFADMNFKELMQKIGRRDNGK